MKNVVVDKIASVAQHNDLASELRLSKDIPCEEGVLIAAKVLNNKSRYNQLELTSGRMATVNQGDVIVGALGHRKALRGYSGHLPTSAWILRSSANVSAARRYDPDPEHRRRTRRLRFSKSRRRCAI
jgi:hypothetical protein